MVGRETLYYNARIWTGLDTPRFAGSFRVKDGRVVELLESSTCRPGETDAVDLGGRFVSPGLIDAHVHLLMGGESLRHVDLSRATSPAEFQEAIAEAHEAREPGEWLIASGWSESNWDSTTPPDKTWLACCGDRPVVCWRMDLHAALVNDAVLEKLALPDDATLASEGGRVVRDDAGGATGLLQEAAAWMYLIPRIPPLPPQQRAEALVAAQRHCLELGLVAVRSMEYTKDVREYYLPTRGPGGLRLSIVQLDRVLPLELEWMAEVPTDEWLRVTGCKSFVDGTFGSRTARMFEAFADGQDNRGMWTDHALEGRLAEWVDEVVAGQRSPVMHAIGDEAVYLALETVRDRHESCRATIEHAQIVTPRVMDLVAATPGIRLSMQPWHRATDAVYAQQALGSERTASMMPLASLAKAGARLSFGSDWPVVTVDPLAGMEAAITGRDSRGRPFHAEECLDMETVLRGYTVEAAEASQLEGSGSLAIGHLADFVTWDHDPFDVDWARVRPRILSTFVGGEQVAGTVPVQETAS
ncbi:MAG: amidohydrolase [Phycisphaerales bacterium]|nr:amidohydrolase [Phycisphaerales bacterium]